MITLSESALVLNSLPLPINILRTAPAMLEARLKLLLLSPGADTQVSVLRRWLLACHWVSVVSSFHQIDL